VRSIIVKSILYTIGLAVLFAGFSILYDYRIRRNDNYLILLDHYRDIAASVRVLILGDSHPAYLHSEELPEGWHNLSFFSESAYEWYAKLYFALEHSPDLHTVVIPFDYHNFTSTAARSSNLRNVLRFLDSESAQDLLSMGWFNFTKVKTGLLFPLLNSSERATFQSVLIDDIYMFFINKIIDKKQPRQVSVDGNFNLINSDLTTWDKYTPEERTARALERLEPQFRNGAANEDLINVFKKLIALCQSRGIRIIGVKYPLAEEYNSLVHGFESGSTDKLYSTVKVGGVLDYSRTYEKSPELFRNQDHLNDAGNLKFTKRLVGDLLIVLGDQDRSDDKKAFR